MLQSPVCVCVEGGGATLEWNGMEWNKLLGLSPSLLGGRTEQVNNHSHPLARANQPLSSISVKLRGKKGRLLPIITSFT